MADSSNFSTVGSPQNNFAIGNIANNAINNLFRRKKKFTYRVKNVFFNENGDCTHIEYESTYLNYGKSSQGLPPGTGGIAYTSNANIQATPKKGERIELFNGPDPYGAAADKSSPPSKLYWKSTEGSLNIWDTFTGDNINLDPTVPGQSPNNQMASLNTVNYNKSLMGMVPKLT